MKILRTRREQIDDRDGDDDHQEDRGGLIEAEPADHFPQHDPNAAGAHHADDRGRAHVRLFGRNQSGVLIGPDSA